MHKFTLNIISIQKKISDIPAKIRITLMNLTKCHNKNDTKQMPNVS